MRIGDLEAGRESKLPYSVRKKMWFGTIKKNKNQRVRQEDWEAI